MKPKLMKHFWKRACGAGLSLMMAVTLLAPAGVSAAELPENNTLNLAKGGTHFFEGATLEGASTSDPSVVTLEAGTQEKKALFDRNGNANNSLSGYSTTQNQTVSIEEAEFTVTLTDETNGYYTIYNETKRQYLRNKDGENYMGDTVATHTLTPVENEDGVSFNIRTAGNTNNDPKNDRYVYYHYNVMKFDGLSEKNANWESQGDFDIEFLERKDSISNLDPIPGYQRATEIVSGNKYLLTEYYHDQTLGDGIIIVYPNNGSLSKLYRTAEVSGVRARAIGNPGTTATVTVGGTTYTVQITECNHEGYPVEIKDARAADCEHAAYTGDVYCTNCNQKKADGREEGSPLGHSYGEWTVGKQPTAEADGEKSRTCSRCDKTETQTVTYAAYVGELLTKNIAAAEKIMQMEASYTPDTFAAVQTALSEAKKLADTASATEKKAKADAIAAAIAALERSETVVSGLKPNVRDNTLKNYFTYTGSWVIGEAESYADLGASTTEAIASGRYYEIHFEGHAISLFARKSHNHGKVKYTVDGEHEQIVDLYNATRLDPQPVYTVENLEDGPHTLKAVTLHEKNSASTSVVNQVAYAEITHAPYKGGTPNLGGTIEDTNTQYTQDRYPEISARTVNTAELTAWKNDKATSELVLYSKNCSLDNATVTVSDLTSGSNTISKDNVTATFIKSTKAYNGGYLGYGDKTRPIPEANTSNRSESSDILYQQGGTMDIPWDSLQPVWVEFQIPKDAQAGTYTGTLTATADGINTPLTFTYTVNVQDMTLPDSGTFADTFDIELWQYPYSSAEYYDVEPFSAEHLKIMESSMEKYKEVGGHAITASIVEEAWNGQTYSANEVHYPSMIKWTKNADGSFSYDYTDFDKWVAFCKDTIGIGDKIVLYSIAPWHNSFTYWEGNTLKYESFSAGNQRYTEVWTDFLEDLIAHLETHGWFEDSYIGIDERGFSAAAFDLIDSVTNEAGVPLKTAGAMDGFVNKKDLAMRVDDLNVGDTAAQEHASDFAKLLEDRTKAGLRTTLYSCTEHKPGNFSLSAPAESYWSIVNAGKMGTAGFLRWAYDAWVEDPLNDATHNSFEPGDCFLIYPDEKGAQTPTSKSSVRLERMAEGVRDINKLMILEQTEPELAVEIQELYGGIQTTAGTARSYLSATEKTRLSAEMTAFKDGIADITDRYLQFSNATGNGIHLLADSKTMEIGSKYQIQAKLVTDQTDKTILYQSSDASVASVDAKGAVTARKRGTAEIRLKNGEYTATVQITVTSKNLIIKNALTDYQLPAKYLSDVEKAPSGTDDRHYLGQPDMIMLDDNKTLITVYPVGHGRGRIVMQVSHDAGEHWTEKEVPESWLDSFETPTIYKLNMTDGTTKLIVISGRPASFGAPTGGWDTSISEDNGETWEEFKTYCETTDGNRNDTTVAMASLVQLKDSDGNFIDKWMGVYHNGGNFINYKTYLTFDEKGNQQWTDPEPYLSEYRSIESSHQICEVGMFRSPDGNRIVALARNQTHNGPATMFYSDDEGETWSEPVELPGSLAGERHKPMYDPTDPTGQRLVIPFREIKYDLNNNNQFDGGNDWVAGDWVAWVGTYDQLMNLEDGMYRILLCEDWAANAKSGDTGYSGIVVQPDGTFIMDSYGHWDKNYSESLPNYSVYADMCWIKQAKFKLSVFDEQVVPGIIEDINEELAAAPAEADQSLYTEKSWNRLNRAINAAKAAIRATDATQEECCAALSDLREARKSLAMAGLGDTEVPVTEIAVTPSSLTIKELGAVWYLKGLAGPETATDKMVSWTSDNPEVATVSSRGKVTTVGYGTATITAEAADGSGVTAKVTVTVPISVTGITVTPASLAFDTIGATQTLTATVQPENATNKTVNWKTGNSAVATVSSAGLVTAVGNGTTKITAEAADGSGVKTEVTVTVGVPVTEITVTPDELTFDAIGAKKKISATVQPETASVKEINWSTSDEAVATVTAAGEVTAVGNGTATITAEAADGSGITAEVTVTVAVPVSGITVTPDELTFDAIGAKKKISATVQPENAANKTINWKTSDEAVATVTAAGEVTAVGNGTATITAEAADGSGITAEVTVTVEAGSTNPGNILVTGITVTPASLKFDEIGATETLKADVQPSTATNKKINWKTSDEKVATVTEDGKVTAIGNGTATITAEAADGSGKTAEVPVTVEAKGGDTDPKTFEVKYDANGGINAPKSETVESGKPATSPKNVPTRTGYTFKGWFTAKTGGVKYDFSAPVTADRTLYAQWTPIKYSVSFNSNGGTAVRTQTVNMNQKATKPADPKKTGFVFGGWFTDSSLRTAYNFNSLVKKNMTLYAKWTPVKLQDGDTRTVEKLEYKIKSVAKKTAVVFKGASKKDKKVKIPKTVKINGETYKVIGIEGKAFKGYSKLSSVTIGANVTTIGKDAFKGCKKLNKVILSGKALKSIKKGAFKNTSPKMTVTAKKLNKKQKTTILKKMKTAGMNKKAKIK